MAQAATIYRFRIDLADMDNGVYEELDFRVAQHPSEDKERVVVRVLARALATEEGLEFGRGLSNVEDPALLRQSPSGEMLLWVDVGMPTADRLHRASKRASRVLIVTHKVEQSLRKEWSARTIHRASEIEVIQLPATLVRDLAEGLGRTIQWYVTLQDATLNVVDGETNTQGLIVRSRLTDFLG
jgi:uncharacterized protein YaeQ